MTPRAHGTRNRYVWGPDESNVPGRGCRCEPCTRASRATENHRTRMITYGRWRPFVDAEAAREHLRMLGRNGIGWRRAARLAGLNTSVVSRILFDTANRPRSRRIRPETEAAILSVRPSLNTLADSAIIDATGTRRRLQALVACGWTKRHLAGRLGMTESNLGTLIRGGNVTAAKARAAAALYDELWDRRPPETTRHERTSASKARNHARARGWAPPGAWDDERIDDPAAGPAEGWRREGRRGGAVLAAEARELFGFGLTRAQAAERLGVALNTLEKTLARYPETAEDGEAA